VIVVTVVNYYVKPVEDIVVDAPAMLDDIVDVSVPYDDVGDVLVAPKVVVVTMGIGEVSAGVT